MTERQDHTGGDESDRVVFRDKRKIDPVTGQARPAAATPQPAGTPPAAAAQGPTAAQEQEIASLHAAVAERTADLQRVQAEYANYRKRADRDRLAAGELAVSKVLTELLPVLDDIDRARAHGDLTGALKAVGDHLEGIFGKLGLSSFGEVGDRFDPAVHEAVMHAESDEVSEPTCTAVMRRGYTHGERLLRPAMVAVTDPATPRRTPDSADAAEPDPGPTPSAQQTETEAEVAETVAEATTAPDQGADELDG